jgi:hypothetical protein
LSRKAWDYQGSYDSGSRPRALYFPLPGRNVCLCNTLRPGSARLTTAPILARWDTAKMIRKLVRRYELTAVDH